MRGWLDRRPTWQRDLIFAVVGAEAAWGADQLAGLGDVDGVWGIVVPVLLVALAAVTRVTAAYGSSDGDDDEGNGP